MRILLIRGFSSSFRYFFHFAAHFYFTNTWRDDFTPALIQAPWDPRAPLSLSRNSLYSRSSSWRRGAPSPAPAAAAGTGRSPPPPAPAAARPSMNRKAPCLLCAACAMLQGSLSSARTSQQKIRIWDHEQSITQAADEPWVRKDLKIARTKMQKNKKDLIVQRVRRQNRSRD